MEGADAAPTMIEEAVETRRRRNAGWFEERSIDATMRLTHAMSPTVVLLVQALDCPVKIWNWLEEAVSGAKVLWSQDGRR